MKSVFWIHSHITYLIALEIIKKHKLDNVVIILAREYTLPSCIECKNIEVYKAPFFRNSDGNKNLVIKTNIFKTRANVKQCISFYNKIFGLNSFNLFIPTSFDHAISLLMDLENCKSYYYIEEGLAAYRCNPNTERRNCIFNLISKYIYNIPPKSFYDVNSKYKGTISFSKKSFLWSDNNEIVDLSLIGQKEYNGSHLFVLGNLKQSVNELYDIYTNIRLYFEQNVVGLVYYKFHPSSKFLPQKESIIRQIFNASKILEFKELDEHVILECCFANTNSTIYSFENISSTQMYLSKFGCIVKKITLKENCVKESIKSFEEIIENVCEKIKR